MFSYTEANVINIFTDASTSTTQTDDPVIVGSGFLVVNQNICIDSGVRVFLNSSSQFGELFAIFMGVNAIYRDSSIKRLYNSEKYYVYNVFSDSRYSIDTIRNYVIKWMSKSHLFSYDTYGNLKPPDLIKADGKPIQHQECITHIVYLVYSTGVEINFYHIKGHLSLDKESDIHTMYKYLYENPNIPKSTHIPINIAKDMIKWNNEIDRLSRSCVYEVKGDIEIERQFAKGKMIWPVSLYLNSRDKQSAYQKLIQ